MKPRLTDNHSRSRASSIFLSVAFLMTFLGTAMQANAQTAKSQTQPGAEQDQAQAEAPQEQPTEKIVTSGIHAQNFEITKLIEQMAQKTGRDFVVDPNVRGKISIKIDDDLTEEELDQVFLTALQINGFSIVEENGYTKIISARNAQRDNIPVITDQETSNKTRSQVGMVTRIFRLDNISPTDINKNLRILPSKDGEMVPITNPPAIIISDYATNIERVEKILKYLEDNAMDSTPQVIQLSQAKAANLAKTINEYFGITSTNVHQETNEPKYQAPRAKRPLAVADASTNSLIVRGTPYERRQINAIVEQVEASNFQWDARATMLTLLGFALLGLLIIAWRASGTTTKKAK